ncbi:MAG: hypothetical protein KKD44_12970 [Proteobacteria bacterium]|nr:hypothetical protein [Pseudomonadota bacterium]
MSDADTPQNEGSKGCQYCQAGQWVCVFLTYLCQAGCSFCPAPHNDDRIWTEFGPKVDDVLAALETGQYRGVGFSGGDCFLVPQRLETWLGHLHGHNPSIYYWVYTNGLEAKPDIVKRLSVLGLNEIRFNTAATGYDHQQVLSHIRAAVDLVSHVAIEIPSIPEDFSVLTRVLPKYADMGVQYLNMHELILGPNDPLGGRRKTRCFNLVGHLDYDSKSRENTQKIIDFCDASDLPIRINDCSINQKEEQMRHRRINNARRVVRPWERITFQGLLETYCQKKCIMSVTEDPDYVEPGMFVHPDQEVLNDLYQKIVFMPPLEKGFPRTLIKDQARL